MTFEFVSIIALRLVNFHFEYIIVANNSIEKPFDKNCKTIDFARK